MSVQRTVVTAALSKLVVKTILQPKYDPRSYWASEVTFDYMTGHPIRPDYLQFKPVNQMSEGGICSGEFTVYEVKSSYADWTSGHGRNFIGDRNCLVTTNELFERIQDEIPKNVTVYTPIKKHSLSQDYVTRDELVAGEVRLACRKTGRKVRRQYSTAEMLFALMRSIGRDRLKGFDFETCRMREASGE